MPSVEFQMTAEESDVLRALLNVTRGQKALEEQVKRNQKASEDWGRASSENIAKVNSQLSFTEKSVQGMIGGLGLAVTAMKAFADYSEARLKILKEKVDTYSQSIQQLDKTLSENGEINLLPEVDAALSGVRSREMNQGQIRELFAHLMKEGGGEFSAQQVIDVVKESVMARAGGKDAKTFGSTMLALKDAGFKDDETGTVADKATELMDTFKDGLGDSEKKFLGQLESSGIDKNQGLRLLKASKESDQGAKVLQQIMNVANADISDSQLKPSKQATPEQQNELERIKARQLEIDKRKLAIDEELVAKPYNKRKFEKEKSELGLEDQKLSLRARDIDAAAPMGLTEEQERLKRLKAIPKGGARIAEIMRSPDLLGDEKASFGAVMGSLDNEAFSEGGAFGFDIQQRQAVINKNEKFRLQANRRSQQIELDNRKLNPTLKDMRIEENNARREAEDQRIIENGGVKGFLLQMSKNLGGDKINRDIEAGADMNKTAAQMAGENEGYTAASATLKELREINQKTRNVPAVSRPPGGAERDAAGGY